MSARHLKDRFPAPPPRHRRARHLAHRAHRRRLIIDGDPAMNGTNVLLLLALGHDVRVWELNVNTRAVHKIESRGPGAFELTGSRDGVDANEMPVSEPWKMTVRYRAPDSTLTIETGNDPLFRASTT
jgi:hypothetical protein